MDKAALLALADRVEALDGPCRETDAAIAIALDRPWNYDTDWRGWGFDVEGKPIEKPVAFSYTASIDPAMTLVPDGMILRSYNATRFVPHTCEVAVDYAHGGWIGHSDHSFALALCAAALRAQASGGEHE